MNLPRTNNAVEAFNGEFQKSWGTNPTIFKLIAALLEENTRVNLLATKIDDGAQFPLYAKLRYQQANERLKVLVDGYSTTPADDYLSTVAHCVLNND